MSLIRPLIFPMLVKSYVGRYNGYSTCLLLLKTLVLPENTHSGSLEKQMAVIHYKHMNPAMRGWKIHACGNMKPVVLYQTSDSWDGCGFILLLRTVLSLEVCVCARAYVKKSMCMTQGGQRIIFKSWFLPSTLFWGRLSLVFASSLHIWS